ncbi:helix-turn-helix domain-containing protein [Streptomyces sp. NBC_00557]|uniref:helix-turn-helix domain-containing protein n=1 Tax=Streptomyces sp. NBC_00557 TaxID=2975776 RepID=UPI002E82214C|nr:helix-turn-helix domain-containing protein [Streptomyces sp. NBC_00557]WUC36825.1 helix-turn-helix domain-containing protein [Streptomyces sp. NBC_00557]
MSRWKQLPDSLDPRVRQLAVQMRRIKDHSGLGLQALAARTGYSRASWDRYLNGRSLPPQEAVAALARACDADPARLLALHEVAVAAGRVDAGEAGETGDAEAGATGELAAGAAEEDTEPEPGPAAEEPRGGGRGRRRMLTAVATSVVLLAAVIALVVAAPWDGGRRRTDDRTAPADATAPAPGASGPKGTFVFRPGKEYPCPVHRARDGLLYAGYSTTRVGLVGPGSAQWAVVEVQCLLRHRGFSPGAVDGVFGAHTERAVERLQAGARIRVDGVVGEDTWGVLRK